MNHSLQVIRISSAISVLAALSVLVPAEVVQADVKSENEQAALDARIAQLIEKLGDDEFATREKAQADLERIGLVAFDALHEAQNHDDIEVAARARYLVRSMRVNWALEDDPPEVKRILRSYGAQNDPERLSRMERLARLDDPAGAGALCRLARFEASKRLSKRAALLVLNVESPTEEIKRLELAKLLKSAVGLSKRPAAQWIITLADTILDAESTVDQWEQLTKAEHDTFTQFPERSSREIVRDLLRWQAEMLRGLDRQDEAVVVMRRSIDLLDGSREQILDMVDWLMERKAWVVVDQVAERFSARFNEDPLLLYRLAESLVQQGKREKAESIAQQALEQHAEDASSHFETAYSLQDRGLLEWSEREFRHVMKLGPAGSFHDLYSRLLLSEMLHDIEKELSAAEVLQGAVDTVQKDAAALEVLQGQLQRDLGSVQSRLHFFYALHQLSLDDRMKHQEHLETAVKADPTDADVLIAMYRLPNADEAWKKETVKRIDAATGHFRDEISKYQDLLARAPSEVQKSFATRQLASMNNQLAWLVGNTVGDYEEALRCSNKSLELRPETAGYLDTLGRCYYAKGDLGNAVKVQRQATKLEPHSQQIRRQLDFFLKEKEEASSANKGTDDAGKEPGSKKSDE